MGKEDKNMLSKNQLKQLRKQIILNSLYTKDYSNNLFIKEKTAYAFFDGYIEYLLEIATDNGIKVNDNNYMDILKKYDTFKNLYEWYYTFEHDPLVQDNYIAVRQLNNADGIVIYYIDYDARYVITSIHYLSGLYIHNTRITKNKLYINKSGDYYFIKNGIKYYLLNFMCIDYGRDK